MNRAVYKLRINKQIGALDSVSAVLVHAVLSSLPLPFHPQLHYTAATPSPAAVETVAPSPTVPLSYPQSIKFKSTSGSTKKEKKPKKEKANKKRPASDLDSGFTAAGTIVDNGYGEPMYGVQIDDDVNEPTMGEKLASLNLVDGAAVHNHVEQESSPPLNPPSADSVHVLLKQALHADDCRLLMDCLYRQDEKVIANSIALLNPSDVLKLLESLLSIVETKGAILVCAIPWLRNLLLQHASGIMSQESFLLGLNSLYQLIDSRVSTFDSALQLSSCLDLIYEGTADDIADEDETIIPVIYEDNDESEEEEEEEAEDAMETDTDSKDFESYSDVEADDGLSD